MSALVTLVESSFELSELSELVDLVRLGGDGRVSCFFSLIAGAAVVGSSGSSSFSNGISKRVRPAYSILVGGVLSASRLVVPSGLLIFL